MKNLDLKEIAENNAMEITAADIQKKIAPIFRLPRTTREQLFPVYAKKKSVGRNYWYFVFLNHEDCIWIVNDDFNLMKNRPDFYREFLAGKHKEITHGEFYKFTFSFFKRVQQHVANSVEIWVEKSMFNVDVYFKLSLSDEKWLWVKDNAISFYEHDLLKNKTVGTELYHVQKVDTDELLQKICEYLQRRIDKLIRLVSPSQLGYKDFITEEKRIPKNNR